MPSLVLRTILAIACLLVLGCGDGAPPRYRVSGSVNFKKQPVPAGSILFEPDAKAGNTGPAGSARIVDGKYETGSKFGVMAGKYIIRIDGADKSGKILFSGYQTKAEFPAQDSSKDIDVPASAADPPKPYKGKAAPPDDE